MQQLSNKKVVNRQKPVQHVSSTALSAHDLHDPMVGAQQTIGNHGLLRRSGEVIQAKLKIGEPNDKYEQEADRIAEMVMRMPEPGLEQQEEDEEQLIQTKPIGAQITPLVQKKAEEEESDEEYVQTRPVSGFTTEGTENVEEKIDALRNGRQHLPRSTRTFFEKRLGHDFRRVQVYTDSRAAAAAKALNATAFTLGHDIAFGAGKFEPETARGRQLLAHELVHVMQQTSSSPMKVPVKIQRQVINPQTWKRSLKAREIFDSHKKLIRPLNDANFPTVFGHHNKVIVIDFWAEWCRPCDVVAKNLAVLAKHYGLEPYASLVKFYHVELNPKINPKLAKQFGRLASNGIPIVFFYYSTGRYSKRSLEASLQGIHQEKDYVSRIQNILRLHGHIKRMKQGSSKNKLQKSKIQRKTKAHKKNVFSIDRSGGGLLSQINRTGLEVESAVRLKKHPNIYDPNYIPSVTTRFNLEEYLYDFSVHELDLHKVCKSIDAVGCMAFKSKGEDVEIIRIDTKRQFVGKIPINSILNVEVLGPSYRYVVYVPSNRLTKKTFYHELHHLKDTFSILQIFKHRLSINIQRRLVECRRKIMKYPDQQDSIVGKAAIKSIVKQESKPFLDNLKNMIIARSAGTHKAFEAKGGFSEEKLPVGWKTLGFKLPALKAGKKGSFN